MKCFQDELLKLKDEKVALEKKISSLESDNLELKNNSLDSSIKA
jgi:hypothetical protein